MEGMVPWSSNYTYLVTLKLQDKEGYGIYKPQCGERPLWDFEDGSLCKREVAAYELSAYLNFPNIPVTVLRECPDRIGGEPVALVPGTERVLRRRREIVDRCRSTQMTRGDDDADARQEDSDHARGG